jgi:hypothetical protein
MNHDIMMNSDRHMVGGFNPSEIAATVHQTYYYMYIYTGSIHFDAKQLALHACWIYPVTLLEAPFLCRVAW